jgi:hypothetical protein
MLKRFRAVTQQFSKDLNSTSRVLVAQFFLPIAQSGVYRSINISRSSSFKPSQPEYA